MNRLHTLPRLVLIGATLALGACGPVNRGLESTHQPLVQQADYALDIPAGRLDRAEQDRLAGWFDALRLGHGDRVSIDDPSGRGADRAMIAAILSRYGVALQPTGAATPGGDPDGVRVVVNRAFANVTGCPDWRRPSQPEFAGSTMSNFGCAVNSNLAAMVADPRDLVSGKEAEPTDARTTVRAIKAYRDAKPTGTGDLKQQSTGGSGSGGNQ